MQDPPRFESRSMPDKLLPWILLFTAILFEVAGITSMTSLRGALDF